MQKHDKKFIIASMVVVGAGLVLGLALTPVFRSVTPTLPFKPFVPPPVYFVQGAPLPEGFPDSLILEKNVALEVAIVAPEAASMEGLSTSTRNMLERQTVQWSSGMSVDALTAAYESYFSKNGWTVTDKSDSPDGKARAVHATKGTASVNVLISSQVGGTQATVGYKAQ